jgi:hypothetical protein
MSHNFFNHFFICIQIIIVFILYNNKILLIVKLQVKTVIINKVKVES